MGFTYQDLISGISAENSQVLIVSDKWTVKGFLTDEIRLDGRSNWREAADPKFQDIANKYLSAGTLAWNQIMSGLGAGGMTMTSRQVKSSATLMVNWEGSENFRIAIPLTFVATSSQDDVRVPIRALYEAIYPTFGEFGKETLGESVGGIADNFVTVMNAPLNYERGNYSKPQGVLRLILGNWFKSTSIFVLDDINFNMSSQFMPSGLPIYATGTVILTSCRPVSSTEVKQWMSKGASPTPKYLTAGSENEYPTWGDTLNTESNVALPDMAGSTDGNVRFFEAPQASETVY